MVSRLVPSFLELFGLGMSAALTEAQAEEVRALLGASLRAMVFNVAAVACLVSVIQEHRKVTPADLAVTMRYIQSRCTAGAGGAQHGGAGMPSDYFGYPHPAYTAEGAFSGTVMSQIDFGANLARPALGLTAGMTGGATVGLTVRHLATESREVGRMVKDVLALHDTSISKTAMKQLLGIIDIHLNCFAEDLANAGPLTPKKVSRALSLRRNLVMQ